MSGSSAPALILLAAGAARRFGSPKALARHAAWQGQSMIGARLAQLLPLLQAGEFSRLCVVLGAHAEPIGAHIAPLLAPYAPKAFAHICPHWADGQSASLGSGIRALQANDEQRATPAAMVALLDQVLLQASDYLALCAHWRHAPHAVCASRYPDGALGAPAIWPRHLWPQLLNLQHDQGARAYLQHARALDLPRAALDIDQRADLLQLEPSPRGESDADLAY
ncbi:NTP transferase domain-containing protein [Massilia sp. W12]|uniref:nucleotidyltransferase family protein n=1 Tax=Massilia sp. W12 TaxID=3126507 RepID=UPI0030D09044